MEYFNKKSFKVFRFLRIIIYIMFFSIFIIIPSSYFLTNPANCIFREKYNIICPTCGITRAFSLIMHFDYKQAFKYNPVFTVAIGPIFIFIFLQDFFNIVFTYFSKRERYSLIEYFIYKFI